jgi:hypothetical protein
MIIYLSQQSYFKNLNKFNMNKNHSNKISFILAIVFITLFSSNLKAQSYVAGPTTVIAGQMNYFYIIPEGGTIASDGYWYTSEDSTQHGFNYGNELSYFGEGTLGDVGITFNTIGTRYIYVHYGGFSNPYGFASLAVTVVAP